MTVQTEFVRKRSELSKVITDCKENKLDVYRTKLICNCKLHNIRSGVLVVQGNIIIAQVIRCRQCMRGGHQ